MDRFWIWVDVSDDDCISCSSWYGVVVDDDVDNDKLFVSCLIEVLLVLTSLLVVILMMPIPLLSLLVVEVALLLVA